MQVRMNSKMHILHLYKSSQVTGVDQYVNNKNQDLHFCQLEKLSGESPVKKNAEEKKRYYKADVK
jgi:hypothetical protein